MIILDIIYSCAISYPHTEVGIQLKRRGLADQARTLARLFYLSDQEFT